MWKDKLCKTCPFDFYQQRLWKSYSFQQFACAKKVVEAVRKNTVFHIFFPYCFYYYKFIYTYIFIYYYLQEMRVLTCVLPVKKVCW